LFSYDDKVKYSQIIHEKFNDISILKDEIHTAIENHDIEKYDFLLSIIYGKMSLIETNLHKIKDLFKDTKWNI